MDLIKTIKGVEYYSIGEEFDYLSYSNRFLGLRLFPLFKTPNMKVAIMDLVKDHKIPVVALVHALDAESQKGDRPDLEEFKEELFLVKQSLNQGEELRKKFRDAGLNITEKMLIDAVYNDARNLISAVLTRFEAMADELLGTGYVTINENNISKVIDYNIPSTSRFGFFDWSNPAHDILGDINTFKKAHPNVIRAYTSTTVLGWIMSNTAVQTIASKVAPYLATEAWVITYFESIFGIEFVNVDKILEKQTYKRRYHDAVEYRFFPSEFITFTENAGELGKTFTTYTPIEDLGAVNGGVDYSETANVVVYTDISKDPAQVKTIAEGMGLPVLADKDTIYFATFA